MSKKGQKALASATIMSLVLTTALTTLPAMADTTDLAGTGRVGTSIAIANKAYATWKTSTAAVITNGTDLHMVDALAVAPLAYAKQAPIFLTLGTNKLEPEIIDALKAQKVTTVYVAGGTVTADVDAQLKAAGVTTVTHFAGKDRVDTANKINKELGTPKGYAVVNSTATADALSIAAIAAKQNYEIVLTSKSTTPTGLTAGLPVYTIGGTGVIDESVNTALKATRLGGSSRYETNAAVLSGLDKNLDYATTYAADGNDNHMVDSLPGSVLAAQTSSPIVLVDDNTGKLDPSVVKALTAKATKTVNVVALGGAVTSAMKDAIMNPVVVTDLKVDSVSAITNTKFKISLKEAGTVLAGSLTVTDKDGKAVAVKSVTMTTDNKTAYVVTDAMTPGAVYTVKVGDTSYKIVAKAANTDKLQVSSAVSRNNVEVKVTFSGNVDPTTALTAANYSIDNSLTVASVALGDNPNEVVLTTSAQTAGKLYKITVSNIVSEDGNALDSNASYVYFGGKAKDTDGPTAAAVASTNTRFKINFSDASDLDEASLLNQANYVIDGSLTVKSLAYDIDANGDPIKNVVVVTTDSQTAGKLYTVTLNNICDKFGNKIKADTKVYFGGKAKDTDGPTATAQSLSNKSVKITLADASSIDSASASNIANYTIDGLTVSAATVSGNIVTLTTTAQTAGKLYKVVINNVKDEYGNAIKANTEAYFGGKAVDTTAPTYTAQTVDNTTAKVYFSGAIDKTTVLPENFYVDGLGYAVAAKLDSTDTSNHTVIITTLKQTSGKVYTLKVTDVKNTDGTAVKSDSSTTFAGMGVVTTAAPKLLAAVPIDSKTVTLTFDQDLAVLPQTVSILNSDDTPYDATTSIAFNGTSRSEVNVQLSSKSLVEGTLYKAVATQAIAKNGVAIGTDNKVTFAGVSITQTGAKILTATAVDNNTVNIYFDKAVEFASTKNATDVANSISLLASDKTTAIKYADTTAVVGQTCTLSEDGKTLTVYFRKTGTSLTLTEGTVYTAQLNTLGNLVTTAGAQATIPDTTGGAIATAQFGGVATAISGPSLLAATPQSEYVVDLSFDRPVALQGAVESKIVVQGTTMPVVKLAKVLDDTKTVRLFLDETTKTAFTEGSVYTIRYTPDTTNYISDAGDTAVGAITDTDAGKTYKDINFAALGTVAKGPAVSGITNVNANTLNVALDQVATGLADANVIVKNVTDNTTLIPGTDYKIIPSADSTSFKVVYLTDTFRSGKTYSVALTATVKDESALRASDATVVTTVGGTATAKLTASIASGTLTATLKDASGTAVGGKELRFRAIVDKGTATTFDTTTIHVENTLADGTDPVTLGTDEPGEQYVIEATDGTIAITVVQ